MADRGNEERIFVFGMSGGGAQFALVGVTGNSPLYDPYLQQIGAIQGVSDAIYGSMAWCPITNLDSADEAYEWMMGVTRSGLSEEEQTISDALAEAFADYVNQAGIRDENGTVLTLEKSETGIYQDGNYYDYIVGVIEESLNNFLSDTQFPYDVSTSSGNDGGPGGMGGFGGPNGGEGGDRGFRGMDGNDNKGGFGDPGGNGDMGGFTGPGNIDSIDENRSYEEKDNITRNETSNEITLSGTYETVNDYIDALNANGTWVTYDAVSNTVSITGIEDFVKAFKGASKNLGAFD